VVAHRGRCRRAPAPTRPPRPRGCGQDSGAGDMPPATLCFVSARACVISRTGMRSVPACRCLLLACFSLLCACSSRHRQRRSRLAQALFRGGLARKQLQHRNVAAAMIQTRARGMVARLHGHALLAPKGPGHAARQASRRASPRRSPRKLSSESSSLSLEGQQQPTSRARKPHAPPPATTGGGSVGMAALAAGKWKARSRSPEARARPAHRMQSLSGAGGGGSGHDARGHASSEGSSAAARSLSDYVRGLMQARSPTTNKAGSVRKQRSLSPALPGMLNSSKSGPSSQLSEDSRRARTASPRQGERDLVGAQQVEAAGPSRDSGRAGRKGEAREHGRGRVKESRASRSPSFASLRSGSGSGD